MDGVGGRHSYCNLKGVLFQRLELSVLEYSINRQSLLKHPGAPQMKNSNKSSASFAAFFRKRTKPKESCELDEDIVSETVDEILAFDS